MMASPFLGVASGLTQGLAAGGITAVNLARQSQEMQLQKQEMSLRSINAFSTALTMPDPAARSTALKALMPGMGMDPNSPEGQQFLSDQTKYMDDTLQSMSDSIKQLGMNMDAKEIGMWMHNDPSGFYNYLFQM